MDAPFLRVAGGVLVLVSISWNRMGPSDFRYRMALVIAAVGIFLAIGRDVLSPSDFYGRFYGDDASTDMGVILLHFFTWVLLLVIGSMLTIRGSVLVLYIERLSCYAWCIYSWGDVDRPLNC